MPQPNPPFYCTLSARGTCHIFSLRYNEYVSTLTLCYASHITSVKQTQSIHKTFHEPGMTSQDQFKIRKIERARNNSLT
eukprot:scaffold16982_cov55-Cylindrotheca_fusiformis.AAC.1